MKIEILERELEGRLLLAMVAAERGHDVLLGTMSSLLSHRFWLHPGIYHDKSVSPKPAKIELFDRLRRAGFVVTSQDEEHGLSEADYSPFAKRRFSERTLPNASRVFTWGPHDTNALLEKYPAHADRFAMTGSPRVDIWRPELASIQQHVPLSGIDRDRPYVLFSTSAHPFQANPFWRIIRDARPSQFPEQDDPREWVHYDKYATAYAYVARLVRAVRLSARQMPDVQFVIRPHPTAVVEAWRDVLGDVPENVRVIREGGSGRWIASAAAVVHNGSTTGVEAAARGVPVISFQPNGERADMFANRVGVVARSEEELLAHIGQALADGSRNAEMSRAVLAERFAALDGPLASDRIVDGWEALDAEGLARPNTPRVARRLAVAHHRVGRTRARLRGALSGRAPTGGFDVSGKFPPLDRTRVDALGAALADALGRFADVRIDRIGPDLVHLSRASG